MAGEELKHFVSVLRSLRVSRVVKQLPENTFLVHFKGRERSYPRFKKHLP